MQHLRQIVEGTYRFTLAHAGRHPWVVLEDVAVDAVGGNVYRVRARVANRGKFPTHVTKQGKELRRLRTVRVEFAPSQGVELISLRGHADLGHQEGLTGSRLLEWFVSCREGTTDLCEIRILGGTGGNTRRLITR